MHDPEPRYCVYNQTRESFLSFNVPRAGTLPAWWKALVGGFRGSAEEGAWLVPSHAVNTFGFWSSIDVIHLDADGRVTLLVEHLGPFRFGPLRRGSASVLILPAHTIYASGTRTGDKLLIALPEELETHLAANSQSSIPTPSPVPGPRLSERGTALVEYALLLPLILLLMLNAANFALYLCGWITINNTARAAAEYRTYNGAAVGLQSVPTYAQVQALVNDEVYNLPNKGSVTITICSNNSSSGTPVITCAGPGSLSPPGDPEWAHFVLTEVQVTWNYQPIFGSFVLPVINVPLTMPATTVVRNALMRNIQ